MVPTYLLAEESRRRRSARRARSANSQTQLSGACSSALRQELLLVYKGKAFQQKVTRLMRQHPEPQAFCHYFQGLVQNVQADVLNKYSFEAADRGMAEIAAAALEACLEGPSAAPLAALIWQAKVADAMDMLRELLACFSATAFQTALTALHRGHHPCSAGFGEHFSSLLAPVYAQVLPKYGFRGDEEGVEDMTLAVGRVLGEGEVQAITASIDSVLYSEMIPQARAPAPEVRPERRLEKLQVARLLREQLAAFSDPGFQHEIAALGGSTRADATNAAGERSRLALTRQQRILPKFGLEGSPRGAHAMLQLCAQHIWDPEVARLAWGVHFLLGVDEPKAVVERLRCIQAEVPLPSKY